jgi:iron complex outermembrane receptor protein
VEARLGDASPILTWVIGGYFFDEGVKGASNVYQSDALQYDLVQYLPTTKASAAFGQTTINVRGDLRLIIGGRYTREHDTLTGALSSLASDPISLLERFGGNKTFSGFTYKTGFEYDLAPANMIYATYSTGFKAGGFSQTVAPLNVYQPEKLDNRLQVNLSAYQWKYKDIQDQRVNFDPLGNINLLTYNSGDATIAGGTLDLIGKLTNADTLSLSTEYANSHYSSYWFQEPAPVFQPASTGCSITGPYAPGARIPYSSAGYTTNIDPTPIVVGSCAGFQVARVPLWSGTVGAQHVISLPGSASLRASAQMHFVGAEWLNIDFVPAERDKSYEVVDADLTYAARGWSLGIFGRNLGNTAYYTGGLQQPFVGGLFAANIGPPRTYGVHADYHFGGE